MAAIGNRGDEVMSLATTRDWLFDRNSTIGLLTTEQRTTTYAPRYQSYVQYMQQLEVLPVHPIKAVTLMVYCIGMASNSLLIAYLIKYKRYRSPTFTLILSLACSDLLTCFGATMLTIFGLHRLNGPEWLCSVLIFIVCWGYDTSTLHLVLFSMIRFYQLLFPLKARSLVTPRLVARFCVLCWSFVAVTAAFLPTCYKAAVFRYKGKLVKICTSFSSDYQLFYETFYELIPTVLISGFHLAKYCILRKGPGSKVIDKDTEIQQRTSTTDTRALVIVIVVYCVTAWPQLIHFYVHYVFNIPVQPIHTLLVTICLTMEYGNSAINPFIYMFCAGSIRRDVVNMIRCRKEK